MGGRCWRGSESESESGEAQGHGNSTRRDKQDRICYWSQANDGEGGEAQPEW